MMLTGISDTTLPCAFPGYLKTLSFQASNERLRNAGIVLDHENLIKIFHRHNSSHIVHDSNAESLSMFQG